MIPGTVPKKFKDLQGFPKTSDEVRRILGRTQGKFEEF